MQADLGNVCGPYCNVERNERGLRLLEYATFNNLVLPNTLGSYKLFRRWTWHSPDGKHHNHIDYILARKCFRSGINIHRKSRHRKWLWPGNDAFPFCLKKKQNQPRLKVEGPRCDMHISSNKRWEVRTTQRSKGWGHGHQHHDYHLVIWRRSGMKQR